MKKLLFHITLLILIAIFPLPAQAKSAADGAIPRPPPIVFVKPPELIVLPGTYVYTVPDIPVDIFFYSGWWWRLWEGRWYRSRNYRSGWAFYKSVPAFYAAIPSDWRENYRERLWEGKEWDCRRLPYHQVQRNWKAWEQHRYWEQRQTWGVQGLEPRQYRHRLKAAGPALPQQFREKTSQFRKGIKPRNLRQQEQDSN